MEADYSTGEQFEYGYDEVGNRTALTDTTGITTYEYDAANRLTSVDGVMYTWDARGNLTHDGTFTYTYNSAGRLVRAESITATITYTYNADGLRVAQSVDGDATTFAWDWASGVPELLRQGKTRYLVGHDTLGWHAGKGWTYSLPDALGSVRQVVDGAGAVVSAREWTPFGVALALSGAEGAGESPAGLGYTGEWFDADVGLEYLRARWYQPGTGRFTTEDTAPGYARIPRSLHIYVYAWNNPINLTDPVGLQIRPPADCEPGEICYTGTTGPYVVPSSPATAVTFANDMMRYCEQYRARLALQAKSGLLQPPTTGDTIAAALCGCCEPPPVISGDTTVYISAEPLGRELAGPITVDSGWYGLWASIIKGYGEGLGGPMIGVTSVYFRSRMEATFIFYEHGTTIDVRDWYNTKSFIWVAPWLGYISLNRDVEVVTTLGEHFGPCSLGKVEGAQEGSGNLPYTLRYEDSMGRPEKVWMRLAVGMPNTGIPVSAVKEYSIWAPAVSLP